MLPWASQVAVPCGIDGQLGFPSPSPPVPTHLGRALLLVNTRPSHRTTFDLSGRRVFSRISSCLYTIIVSGSHRWHNRTGFLVEGGTMNVIQSRARLAERAAAASTARPALPIRRAAAEEALRDGDGPVELTFDVVRVGGATETMSMTLERSDLERALQSANGEQLA